MNLVTKCTITDPLPYMIAYLDGREDLKNDEREILLFALFCETKNVPGSLVQRATAAIKERDRASK